MATSFDFFRLEQLCSSSRARPYAIEHCDCAATATLLRSERNLSGAVLYLRHGPFCRRLTGGNTRPLAGHQRRRHPEKATYPDDNQMTRNPNLA
jgi:hypothetical protein